MEQSLGFCQSGCTSVMLRPKCVREAMTADIPGCFAVWASRAHAVIDSQLRRIQSRSKVQDGNTEKNQKQQQKKRGWWRLDPEAVNKYKPIEPPETPDPDIFPTVDRIVFPWEAPMSPLEKVLQEDVRKLSPKLHEWIVRRAIERAGLSPHDDPFPEQVPVPDDLSEIDSELQDYDFDEINSSGHGSGIPEKENIC